jgi:hypothetical protein
VTYVSHDLTVRGLALVAVESGLLEWCLPLLLSWLPVLDTFPMMGVADVAQYVALSLSI